MKIKFSYLFLLVVGVFIGFAIHGQSIYLPDSVLPTTHKGYLIHHQYYTLSYSNKDRQAEWVEYALTPEMINGFVTRKNNFKPDPLVKNNPVHTNEYTKCGYDRGHLCPAADMKLNETAMNECFYLSNISPQQKSFNRGIWQQLENKVREWAIEKNGVYVITGPVLQQWCGSISNSSIGVPCLFYKIIFKETNNNKNVIAFLLPNESGKAPLHNYLTTVNYLENITGINFFSYLPNEVEEKLESTIDADYWNF